MPTTILDNETYPEALQRRYAEETKAEKQAEIIRSPLGREQLVALAREACAPNQTFNSDEEWVKRFAALVAAHVKSDQINTAYQQGCEDMKRRMEKRMQQLESQLQLCQTAVADEREACAKVCKERSHRSDDMGAICAAAIRSRSNEH